MRNALLILVTAAALMQGSPLQAASTNAQLPVSSVVPVNCRIAIPDLAFSQYDPLDQNASRELNGAVDVKVICTRDARANIVIDSGRNGSGRGRAMSDGGQKVNYELYRDSGRTQVWGSGGNGLQFVATGLKDPQRVTLYARIPPGQEVASGIYTDVVVATVDF